jgi:hypothetical protein
MDVHIVNAMSSGSNLVVFLDRPVPGSPPFSDGSFLEPLNGFKKMEKNLPRNSGVWLGRKNSPPTGKSSNKK